MKNSIRVKMSAWVVGSMSAIILIGGIVGSFFIEDYYLNTKKDALVAAYDKLSYLLQHDEALSDTDNIDNLNNYCETQGITLVVLDSDGKIRYSYGADGVLAKRLQDILFEQIFTNPDIEESLIEESENYILNMVSEKNMDNSTHLEMFGNVGIEQFFVMRIAVQNVRESIEITNRFYGALSLVLVIIVAITILIVTSRLTKPILQLADISKKMSDLNFDVHYEDKRDDEIGILGQSMNEMSRELEKTISELKSANIELQNDIDKKIKIDKMRTEFLSNVSHELKTPIALIQGYAEGLKEGVTDNPESMDFYCDVIIDEANKMNKMVKNLLTLNQIEFGTGQVSMERFDVVELIKGVLNAQKIRARQNQVRVLFEHDEPIYVWADEFQIEEVITNYISNAFNHVKGNRLIEVKIKEKGGIVRVSVFNSGSPIPEEDLEHIWEKFYKVDKARTREYGGNGIGLSIVKAIMERMGTSCGAINHPEGVEFWFELDSCIRQKNSQI